LLTNRQNIIEPSQQDSQLGITGVIVTDPAGPITYEIAINEMVRR
jgi:hypothetical protein